MTHFFFLCIAGARRGVSTAHHIRLQFRASVCWMASVPSPQYRHVHRICRAITHTCPRFPIMASLSHLNCTSHRVPRPKHTVLNTCEGCQCSYPFPVMLVVARVPPYLPYVTQVSVYTYVFIIRHTAPVPTLNTRVRDQSALLAGRR